MLLARSALRDAGQQCLQFALILLDGAYALLAAADVPFSLCQQGQALLAQAIQLLVLLLERGAARGKLFGICRDMPLTNDKSVELAAQGRQARCLRVRQVTLVAQLARQQRRILLFEQQLQAITRAAARCQGQAAGQNLALLLDPGAGSVLLLAQVREGLFKRCRLLLGCFDSGGDLRYLPVGIGQAGAQRVALEYPAPQSAERLAQFVAQALEARFCLCRLVGRGGRRKAHQQDQAQSERRNEFEQQGHGAEADG